MADRTILLIDNFDSFTYNIEDYLKQCGVQVFVIESGLLSPSDIHDFDGVVFAPGPGNPMNMPDMMTILSESVKRKPTFGICLGFQAIALHFGAKIGKGNPVHGKISQVYVKGRGRMTKGLPGVFDVVRYHSLAVTAIPSPLQVVLETENGDSMGIEHMELPIMGVQFHPEAHLTQFGIPILKNWLDLCF
jgi:anthranilate synthase component 2